MTKLSFCVVHRVLAEIYAEIRITMTSFAPVADRGAEHSAKRVIIMTVCINLFIVAPLVSLLTRIV